MYSINLNAVSKSTINELIAFYKRQKLDLRESGTRLIRPITRPDYMINNEEIRTLETLGKVRILIGRWIDDGCRVISDKWHVRSIVVIL